MDASGKLQMQNLKYSHKELFEKTPVFIEPILDFRSGDADIDPNDNNIYQN